MTSSSAPALSYHRLDGALFDQIASGGGGAVALASLRDAEYSRRVVLARAIVDHSDEWGGTVSARAREAWSLLGAAHRRAPTVVQEVLTYPSVGPAHLWALNQLMGEGPAVEPSLSVEALTKVAATAAIRTGLCTTVELRIRGGGLLLPSLGRARFPTVAHEEPALVCISPAGVTVEAGGSTVRIPTPHCGEQDDGRWLGLRALIGPDRGSVVLLDDLDPYAFPSGDHPGRLSTAQWRRWRRAFENAWDLLQCAHPEPAAEVSAAFRAIVPISAPNDRNISSSSDETFGCSVLSAPRSPLDLALALVHELQHNKLTAITHLFDLIAQEPGELFYAPWREDPRPLCGLLHGVYAHMGVAQFWYRQRRIPAGRAATWRAVVEFARWREAAREANGTLLASGCLTSPGRRFAERMGEVLDELAQEPVPRAAAMRAAELSACHRGRWASTASACH